MSRFFSGDENATKVTRLGGEAALNGSTQMLNAQPLVPETCVSLHLFNSVPIISELFSYIGNVPPPFELIAHLDIQVCTKMSCR